MWAHVAIALACEVHAEARHTAASLNTNGPSRPSMSLDVHLIAWLRVNTVQNNHRTAVLRRVQITLHPSHQQVLTKRFRRCRAMLRDCLAGARNEHLEKFNSIHPAKHRRFEMSMARHSKLKCSYRYVHRKDTYDDEKLTISSFKHDFVLMNTRYRLVFPRHAQVYTSGIIFPPYSTKNWTIAGP